MIFAKRFYARFFVCLLTWLLTWMPISAFGSALDSRLSSLDSALYSALDSALDSAWPRQTTNTVTEYDDSGGDSGDNNGDNNGEGDKTAALQEEIVVRGNRLVTRQFVDQKRFSEAIVDSLGENEVASLPALNAAEIVKNLPGVAAFNDGFGSESGERGGGVNQPTTLEQRFASVRGIRGDLNLTLMDGLNLAVPNQAGRANFLDWFPVSLAKRVEVIKTLSAEQDGNAIGGIINIVTRRGSEYSEPLFNVTGSVNFDRLDDGPEDQKQPFNLSAVYASPLTDRVGLTASVNFNRRHIFMPIKNNEARVYFNDPAAGGARAVFFPLFHHPTAPAPGNGIAVPLVNRLVSNSTRTERYGAAAKIDFAITQSSIAWMTAATSILDQTVFGANNDVRQPFLCFAFLGCRHNVSSQTGGQTGTGSINVVNGVETLFSDALKSNNNSRLNSAQIGLDHFIGDDLTLELRAGYSRATQEQLDQGAFYAVATPDANYVTNYDLSDPLNPIFNVDDPDTVFDPARYTLARFNHLELDLEEDVIDIIANLGFNTGPEDRGWGFKGGLRYKKNDRKFAQFYDRYDTTPAGRPRFTLDRVLSPVSGQSLGIPNAGNFRTILQDTDSVLSQLRPRLNDTALFTRVRLSELADRHTIREDTLAAFVYARYRGDRVLANFGLRYEDTENAGAGFIQSATGRVIDGAGNSFDAVASKGSQDFLLPALSINYDVTDHLKLRLAYSRSLGRAGYNSLAPQGDTRVVNAENGTASINIANPNLKPRRSDNYDIALEWYIDNGAALLGIGHFQKDIRDEIFVDTRQETIDVAGVPIPLLATISQVQNIAKAKLSGVELNVVKDFSFFSHPFFASMGINANATFIDADYPDLLRVPIGGGAESAPGFIPGQPEKMANVSIYYTDERWDMNLSLNYTGDFVTFFNSNDAGQDVYNLSQTTINAKIIYTFNDNFRFFVEGNNLGDEALIRVSGPPARRSIRRRFVGGRSIALGAIYTF